MNYTESQLNVINTKGNVVVKASAGTGKTATMVAKIEKEFSEIQNHKVIAAITFTIKAAKEIKSRIKVQLADSFIGTNNSFVLEEIIKPFYKDIYEVYSIDFTTDYSRTFNTYEEGLELLHSENIVGSYSNRSSNRQKSFIFELALNVVKESKICARYLDAKYEKIYVDEYQDSNEYMHNFFMYLNEQLNIDLFIVGDDKQSIYSFMSAYPKYFLSVYNSPRFNKFDLLDNFRCREQIQDYSNMLIEDVSHLFKGIGGNDVNIICYHSNKIDSSGIINEFLEVDKSCAVLRFSNSNAENEKNKLNTIGLDFRYVRTPVIASITSSESILYTAVAKYFIVKNYTEYDFYYEIPSYLVDNQIEVKHLKKLLKFDISNKTENQFSKEIVKLFSYLRVDINDRIINNINSLYNDIINEDHHSYFILLENEKAYNKLTMTFHSSKGLEFDQVFVFAEDYNLNDKTHIYNHYVAVTRAKSRLSILVDLDNGRADKFCSDLNSIYTLRNKMLVREAYNVVYL